VVKFCLFVCLFSRREVLLFFCVQMTDDSSSPPPCVPSIDRVNEKKPPSAWNFDELHDENSVDDNSADFFSVLKQNIEKNVYFNAEQSPSKTRPTAAQRSTQRIDSSDLISRCKQFLPLLTDANRNLFSKIQAGENVRIELDDEENEQEQAIEMNLMFCPNMDSSSSSSSDSESDNELQSIRLPQQAQSNSVNIVEINSSNQFEDN